MYNSQCSTNSSSLTQQQHYKVFNQNLLEVFYMFFMRTHKIIQITFNKLIGLMILH